MSTTHAYILRACPDPAKAAVAQFLGKAFSLKDSTCSSIADSAPIILLADLSAPEAAVINILMAGLARAGAQVELLPAAPDELPKIDWPRKPQVFKRDLTEIIADYQIPVNLPGGGRMPLLDLLVGTLTGQTPAAPRAEFKGSHLPEITPFGGVASLAPAPASKPPTGRNLPSLPTPLPGAGVPTPRSPQPQPTAKAPASRAAPASTTAAPGEGPVHAETAMNRLNELFPEDESAGFLPNNQDISSILDKLLPDEAAPLGSAPSGSASGAVRQITDGGGGYSVFLAKISDEARRAKAVPLIAELAGLGSDDAEALSKKVIIPVLKGATKDGAEAAKQKFAKIGILARVKGPE